MHTVVIQHIETIWTKQSRGGLGAARRNAVRESFKLPVLSQQFPFVVHTLSHLERSDFKRVEQSQAAESISELNLKCLTLTEENGQLCVRFHRDPRNAARPSPYPHADVFALEPTEWGRLVYNGRFVSWMTGEWWYEEHVYNISWLDDIDCRIFVDNSPASEFREMAILK